MIRHPFAIALSSIALLTTTHSATDWRIDLLKSKGIPITPEALKKATSASGIDTEKAQELFQKLGDPSYQERENAQQALLTLGNPLINFLKSKKPIENPEVRRRSNQIEQQLESNITTPENLMLVTAAKSLLKNRDDKSTGGEFYEWFGTPSKNCSNGYRQWTYQGPKNGKPFVKNSRLFISGDRPDEIDQHMILHSASWPSTKILPKQFTVSCQLGGTHGGAGTWHIGISIGKVRALFHPGYRNGGFRFEQAATATKYTDNVSMGHTPSHNRLHLMKITVTQLDDGKVRLKANITTRDQKPFEHTVTVTQEDIGPLNQISLDRSGRPGGDAYFDHFRVSLAP